MRSLPRIPVDLETSAHPPAASPVTGQRARVGNAGDNPQMSVTLGNRDRALVDFLFRTLEPQPISFGRLNRALDPAAARRRPGSSSKIERSPAFGWVSHARFRGWQRPLFPHPRQPTAGARSSQPQCQVLHAKADCGWTVRTAVEPATSAKATAASPRNFFMVYFPR